VAKRVESYKKKLCGLIELNNADFDDGNTGLFSEQSQLDILERLNCNKLSDVDKKNLYCSNPQNDKLNKAIEGLTFDGVSMKDSPMRAATGRVAERERQCNETFAWNPGVIGMEDLYKELNITTPQAKYADMIDMFDAPEGGRRRRRRRKSRKKRRKSRKKRKRKRKRTRRKRRRK